MRQWFIRAWNSPSITTWVSLALRAGGAVVTLPLLLATLPPTEVAVWYLLLSVTNIAQLLDFGFGPTTTRAVAYAIAGRQLPGSPQESAILTSPLVETELLLGSLIQASKRIYLQIAAIAFTITGILGVWMLDTPISKLPSTASGYTALTITLAAIPILITNNALLALIQGSGHVALVRRWDSIFLLASIASTLLVLKLGGPLYLLALSAQIWNSISLIRSLIIFRNRFPTYRKLPENHPQVLESRNRMWPVSWRYGTGTVLYTGSLQASGLIYAQFGSPVGIASYMVAMQILSLLKTTSQAPFQSKIPVLASLYAKQNLTGMLTLARSAALQSYWAFTLPFLVLAVATPPILLTLKSKTPFVTPAMWGLMGIGALLERLGGTHQQLLSISNNIQAHLAGLGFSIVFSLSLALFAGSIGAYTFPIAVIAGHLLFFTPFSLYKSQIHFNLAEYSFNKSTFLPPLIIIATFSAILTIVTHFFKNP